MTNQLAFSSERQLPAQPIAHGRTKMMVWYLRAMGMLPRPNNQFDMYIQERMVAKPTFEEEQRELMGRLTSFRNNPDSTVAQKELQWLSSLLSTPGVAHETEIAAVDALVKSADTVPLSKRADARARAASFLLNIFRTTFSKNLSELEIEQISNKKTEKFERAAMHWALDISYVLASKTSFGENERRLFSFMWKFLAPVDRQYFTDTIHHRLLSAELSEDAEHIRALTGLYGFLGSTISDARQNIRLATSLTNPILRDAVGMVVRQQLEEARKKDASQYDALCAYQTRMQMLQRTKNSAGRWQKDTERMLLAKDSFNEAEQLALDIPIGIYKPEGADKAERYVHPIDDSPYASIEIIEEAEVPLSQDTRLKIQNAEVIPSIKELERHYAHMTLALEPGLNRETDEQRKELLFNADLLLSSEKGQAMLSLAYYFHLLGEMPKEERAASNAAEKARTLLRHISDLEALEQASGSGQPDSRHFYYSIGLSRMFIALQTNNATF